MWGSSVLVLVALDGGEVGEDMASEAIGVSSVELCVFLWAWW